MAEPSDLHTAALKLQSRSWSTGTLQQGKEVLAAQQVKLEDDAEVLALSNELEDSWGACLGAHNPHSYPFPESIP